MWKNHLLATATSKDILLPLNPMVEMVTRYRIKLGAQLSFSSLSDQSTEMTTRGIESVMRLIRISSTQRRLNWETLMTFREKVWHRHKSS